MTLLLDALEVQGPLRRALVTCGILTGVLLALIGIAAIEALAERQAGLGPGASLAFVGVVWTLWTLWHSYLFARNRRRRQMQAHSYRKAFLRDILPGATICVSQMLRPALNGDNLAHGTAVPRLPSSPVSYLVFSLGLLVFSGALLLFASALQALGPARMVFTDEFLSPETFKPVQSGPYRRVRHPLFWSGVLMSFGLACLYERPVAYAIAAINAGYGLAYNVLEDHRLCEIFGDRYKDYAREVPRIIPRLQWRRNGDRTGGRHTIGAQHREGTSSTGMPL